MRKLWENVFQVSTLIIQQALCFPVENSHTTFSEESSLSTFQDLYSSNYAQLSFFLMPARKKLPMEPPQFPLDTFVEEVRLMLQILAKILGKEDTNTVDKAILGIFSLMMNLEIVFDIPSFGEK